MRSFLAPLASASAALTACASTSQDGPCAPETAERATVEVTKGTTAAAAVTAAAPAPVPEPVSAAENPHPGTSASAPRDLPSDAGAQGRRTISTAFVRLGPGGHLLVTLRDGSELALRDVTMEKRAFCGMAVAGGSGERQCRGYAEVVAARAVDAVIGVAPVPPG